MVEVKLRCDECNMEKTLSLPEPNSDTEKRLIILLLVTIMDEACVGSTFSFRDGGYEVTGTRGENGVEIDAVKLQDFAN